MPALADAPRAHFWAVRQGATRRDSRTILFDATAALPSERTTIAISLSEIAQRSGLNSALLNYYFGGGEGGPSSPAARPAR